MNIKYLTYTSFTVHSTGRGENGRTPIKTFIFSQGKWSSYSGEAFDSNRDLEVQNQLDKEFEHIRRDSILKQARSRESAKKVWVC